MFNVVSAKKVHTAGLDLVITDPPYHDAIPFIGPDGHSSMYGWTRCSAPPGLQSLFSGASLSKWSREENDGELIDEPEPQGGNAAASKALLPEWHGGCLCRLWQSAERVWQAGRGVCE